jgi:hypothetical protein
MAHLLFDHGHLSEVTTEVLIGHEPEENFNKAIEIRGMLGRKYGPPASCSPSAQDTHEGLECRWHLPGIDVGLSYLHVEYVTDKLLIDYRARRDHGEGKL